MEPAARPALVIIPSYAGVQAAFGRYRMKRMAPVVGMLASCVPMGEPAHVDRPPHWALQTLQGERMTDRPGRAATLTLNADHSVGGTVGCNSTSSAKLRWWGALEEKRGSFDRSGRGAGITTTALCRDREAEAIGNRFWALMETARAWSVDDRDLVIAFADGSEARLIASED